LVVGQLIKDKSVRAQKNPQKKKGKVTGAKVECRIKIIVGREKKKLELFSLKVHKFSKGNGGDSRRNQKCWRKGETELQRLAGA